MISLTVVIALGIDSIASLIVFALLLGTGGVLFDTASLAAVPQVLGTITSDRLTRANARLESADIVGNRFLGPPLGATLFAAVVWLPSGLDAASFLASALLLARLTTGRPDVAVARTARGDVAAAIRWMRSNPLLRRLAIVVGLINLSFAMVETLLVLLIEEDAGAGAAGYAVVLTLGAVGAFAGSLVAARLARNVPLSRLLPGVAACFAAALLLMGAIPRLAVVAIGLATVGLAGGVWNVVTVAIRQRITPPDMLGRVNSIYRLIAYSTIPGGAVLGGAIARATSTRLSLVVAAVISASAVPLTALMREKPRRATRTT
jgi:predicted MFS family arabinose efflux permease